MVLPPKPPVDAKASQDLPQATDRAEIDAFLNKVKETVPQAGSGRGRLIFAMDATLSREPTWDMALKVQTDMFRAVQAAGGLDVQLAFFRGPSECRTSRWVSDAETLAALMSKVKCEGGFTQIRKILLHAIRAVTEGRVHALVFVGDAMEESIDELADYAGQLGLLGVPVFMFQEGNDPQAQRAFQEIARLTRGATCRFGPGAADELAELLKAVAVYASGGRAALANYAKGHRAATVLLEQLSKP